jgi:hypothetical protein
MAAALAAWSCVPAQAETTLCNEIPSIPFVISTGGKWCLKKDLASAATSGAMITVNTNNVVIDMNDYKLGGLAAGGATTATGIRTTGRKNIEVRNGTIRGFQIGVDFVDAEGGVVEGVLLDANTAIGVRVADSRRTVVRNNRILDTGLNGVSSFAAAVRLQQGSQDSLVENNYISGVLNSALAYGVHVSVSWRNTILGNTIQHVHAAVAAKSYGVYLESANGTLVRRNDFMNADRGIAVTGDGASTKSVCMENSVNGYSVGFVSCAGQ